MNRRVGYRFHPTDEELVDYFLKSKLNGIDFDDDIRVVDICNIEPCDLPKYAAQGSNDRVWHFFYRKELKDKSKSKPRYNRSTKTGHWKPTGTERPVKAKRSRKEIGMKRTLVFYKHGEPKELRTNWVIHEYELRKASPSKQGDWVVCKLKEKADGKADASTSLVAELSHCVASDFEIRPAAVPISQLAPQLLLQTLFPGNGVNFDHPSPSPLQPQIHIGESFSEFQPQIHLEEGISDEELMLAREIFKNGSDDGPMLTNDVFQNSSNELNYQSNTIELQEDPDELPDETVNYICVLTRVTDDCNPESLSGYLEEINNIYSDNVHGRVIKNILLHLDLPCKSPKESFAQSSTSKDFQPYSFQEVCERFKAPEQSLCSIKDLQKEIKNIKLSSTSKPKAREDRKHGTDLDLPRKSPKESFARTRTSKDFQPYSFQEICERLKAPERSLCSIQDLQEEIKNTKLEIQELKKNIEIIKRIPEEGLMKYKNTQVRKNPETSLSNDKNSHEDFIKAISVKTKRDQKKVTAKTSLKSRTDGMTSNDKICSSIDHPEISLLNQRISTISLDC